MSGESTRCRDLTNWTPEACSAACSLYATVERLAPLGSQRRDLTVPLQRICGDVCTRNSGPLDAGRGDVLSFQLGNYDVADSAVTTWCMQYCQQIHDGVVQNTSGAEALRGGDSCPFTQIAERYVEHCRDEFAKCPVPAISPSPPSGRQGRLWSSEDLAADPMFDGESPAAMPVPDPLFLASGSALGAPATAASSSIEAGTMSRASLERRGD